jgi:hypothetical protein
MDPNWENPFEFEEFGERYDVIWERESMKRERACFVARQDREKSGAIDANAARAIRQSE